MAIDSVLVALLLAQASAESPCLLPELRGKDPVLYQNRGDRCEGSRPQSYAIEPRISLLAYFVGPPAIENRVGGFTVVHVAGVERSTSFKQIVIRHASSLGRTSNYFMDTVISGSSYKWPNDVIKSLPGFTDGRGLLGYACAPNCGARPAEITYYPVQIAPQGSAASSLRILKFSIPAAVTSVTVRLHRGQRVIPLRTVPGPFNSTYQLVIPLDPALAGGAYLLEVTGKARNGPDQSFSANIVVP